MKALFCQQSLPDPRTSPSVRWRAASASCRHTGMTNSSKLSYQCSKPTVCSKDMIRKKTIEEHSQIVWEKYRRTIYVIPGQIYRGNKSKLWYYCVLHGPYEAYPNNVIHANKGSSCRPCRDEQTSIKIKARNELITQSFFGKITIEGHKIIECVGHQMNLFAVKKGKRGSAKFRYLCGRCGNDQAVAIGSNLKIPGKTPGCTKCHKYRESIARHLADKTWAESPCQFYIVDILDGKFLKIGISSKYSTRATLGNKSNPFYDQQKARRGKAGSHSIDFSYGHIWLLHEPLPRAWVFSIEQILLKATEDYRIPQDQLPKEMIAAKWPGMLELRFPEADQKKLITAFHSLRQNIENREGDWYRAYKENFGRFKI